MTFERLNAYRIMWLLVMFDLPVTTKQERKEAALFRKNLEKDGFAMHQFSVYLRYCASLESAQVHIKRVKNFAPGVGHITVLTITDKQYSNIVNIWGKIEKKSKPTPIQLEFF
ncbi:MAG: CRISPR-associated endonuclease Cas2 [Prevotella sp.]|nr:CRISPR-associated endonuclease Cas2 [Prevotella sp.]